MPNKKLTRKEFLRTAFLGLAAIIAMPLLRLFKIKADVSHKEAGYYKNLAG